MGYLSIRDLQKISGEAISALPGPTAVKSGDRTVAVLLPLGPANRDSLMATLARAETLAKRRNRTAADATLEAMGVDTTDWSIAATRRFMARHKKRR